MITNKHTEGKDMSCVFIIIFNQQNLIGDVERKFKQTVVILNITINPTGKANITHNICKNYLVQKGSSVDGTPSKNRRIDQPVESPRKRKKREQPSTPVHQVIREAVFERSPAVSVSGKNNIIPH